MLTCKDCKDEACPDMGNDGPGCEDFTSRAIEGEHVGWHVEWQPTLEDYQELAVMKDKAECEITRLEARLDGYENAVAKLVRWAQNDETP